MKNVGRRDGSPQRSSRMQQHPLHWHGGDGLDRLGTPGSCARATRRCPGGRCQECDAEGALAGGLRARRASPAAWPGLDHGQPCLAFGHGRAAVDIAARTPSPDRGGDRGGLLLRQLVARRADRRSFSIPSRSSGAAMCSPAHQPGCWPTVGPWWSFLKAPVPATGSSARSGRAPRR